MYGERFLNYFQSGACVKLIVTLPLQSQMRETGQQRLATISKERKFFDVLTSLRLALTKAINIVSLLSGAHLFTMESLILAQDER